MNKVILMGRLTRDAEIRYSQGESSSVIARFTMLLPHRHRRRMMIHLPEAETVS